MKEVNIHQNNLMPDFGYFTLIHTLNWPQKSHFLDAALIFKNRNQLTLAGRF